MYFKNIMYLWGESARGSLNKWYIWGTYLQDCIELHELVNFLPSSLLVFQEIPSLSRKWLYIKSMMFLINNNIEDQLYVRYCVKYVCAKYVCIFLLSPHDNTWGGCNYYLHFAETKVSMKVTFRFKSCFVSNVT